MPKSMFRRPKEVWVKCKKEAWLRQRLLARYNYVYLARERTYLVGGAVWSIVKGKGCRIIASPICSLFEYYY